MQKYEVTGTARGTVEKSVTRTFEAENEEDAADQFVDFVMTSGDFFLQTVEVDWEDADVESIQRA